MVEHLEVGVGFLPWQKVFLPGQWKKPGEKPAKTAIIGVINKIF